MIGASYVGDFDIDRVWEFETFDKFVHAIAAQPLDKLRDILDYVFDPANNDLLEQAWKRVEGLVKRDMMRLAAEEGYIELFVLLVQAFDMIPDEHHLQYAVVHNRERVVSFILYDGRVDPSSYAISLATRAGFKDIVEVLLEDPRTIPGDAVLTAAQTNSASLVRVLARDPRTTPEYIARALRYTLTARDGSARVAHVLLRENTLVQREELVKRLLITPNPGVRKELQEYLMGTTANIKEPIGGECILSSEVGTVVVTKDGFVMLRMLEMIPEQLVAIARKYVNKIQPTWKLVAPYRWQPNSGPHVSLDKSMAIHAGKQFNVRVSWQPHAFVDYSRWVVLNVDVPKELKCAPGGGCHISIGQQRPPF
jgi:hypothetical protein